jgi:hypothetical protein
MISNIFTKYNELKIDRKSKYYHGKIYQANKKLNIYS